MTYTFNRPAFLLLACAIFVNEHLRSMVREDHLTTDHLLFYSVFVLPGPEPDARHPQYAEGAAYLRTYS